MQAGDKKAALEQSHGNGHGLSLPLSKTFLIENPARYTFAARIVAPPLRSPPNSSIAAPPREPTVKLLLIRYGTNLRRTYKGALCVILG